MKKTLKFVCWTLLGLVALVVLLVATLPLWLGPVARPLANRVAPAITKTDFHLGLLSLNPYTGRLEVGDVLIGNPAGYSEPRAVELGKLTVAVDLASALTDCIHVREVTLSDCFVSYLIGGEDNVDNLTQIQVNVAGGKEKYEAAKRRQEQAAAEAEAEADEDDDEEEDDDEPLRLVIDRVSISGVRVKLQMLTIPVPPITLTDLGMDTGGITLTELGEQVWAAILKGASSVGDGAAALGGLVNSAAGDLGSAIKDAASAETLKSANDEIKKVEDEAKKATESLKKLLDF